MPSILSLKSLSESLAQTAILRLSLFLLATLAGTPAKASSSVSSAPEAREAIALGLNDVAILMPYESHPDMIATAPTVAGFVPPFAIEEIQKILLADEQTHASENFAFGNLGDQTLEPDIANLGSLDGPTPFRLVSIRIDPCANSLARLKNGEACVHEVRNIWQPMTIEGGKAFTIDVNLHSIHRLDDKAFKLFIKDLRALRTISAPKSEALSANPTLVREGKNGHYFEGLMHLLKTQIGLQNLKRVAFFADTNPNFLGHWTMLAFDLEGEKIIRAPSPTLGKQPGENQKLVQRIEGAPNRLGEPRPLGDFADNLFPPMPEPASRDEASMMELAKNFLLNKYQRALALENPQLHEPANADCASCHMAVIEKFKLKRELEAMGLALPKEEFKADEWNLSSQVTPDSSPTALQIFSFFKNQSRIAPRVIHDAVLSAERINAMKN